ncbi:MAG: metal ABC transporter permease [Thermodesulfobacteriota bacterium]
MGIIEGIVQVATLFPQALLGGIAVAVACALLGVLAVLKRVVFIGITLSEVANLGVALGLAWGLPHLPLTGGLTLAAAAALALPRGFGRLTREAVLGVVFVLASSLAVLVVANSGFGLGEVKALLYGDLLLASPTDNRLMLGVLAPVSLVLLTFLRPIAFSFLDRDAARVLGLRVVWWELVYFACLGLAVAAAAKSAGALLVFGHLVIAPSAALVICRRLGWALAWAAGLAVAASLAGLGWSFAADLPAGQCICVVEGAMLGAALLGRLAAGRARRGARDACSTPAG